MHKASTFLQKWVAEYKCELFYTGHYFVERARAFFMCLAKTRLFNYVYELSKGRSTESTEVENKVLLLPHDEQESACHLLAQAAAQSAPQSWCLLQPRDLCTENRNPTS